MTEARSGVGIENESSRGPQTRVRVRTRKVPMSRVMVGDDTGSSAMIRIWLPKGPGPGLGLGPMEVWPRKGLGLKEGPGLE